MEIKTLKQLAKFCRGTADLSDTAWKTECYKNAPDTLPQIGDIVECGLPGDTAVVASIGPPPRPDAMIRIINCAIDGMIHLNQPSAATFVRRP